MAGRTRKKQSRRASRKAGGRAGRKVDRRAGRKAGARAPEQPASSTGIWAGTISFSLVAIPVELVTAVGSGRVSFRLLHKKDNSPLRRRMYCPKDRAIVPPEETVRGYTVGLDKYMPVTDRELESLSPERSRTIEIVQFVDLGEVDVVYFERPYYLVPTRGGEKAYCLLAEVMARAGKAALAKFVLEDREYLVAVKSKDGALSLLILHYNEDILPYDDIAPSAGKPDARETARVTGIIKGMLGSFRPSKYADERRKKIQALLKAKIGRRAAVESPQVEEEEGEGPVDLVAALEKSMQKAKSRR
jgi:DNA end-binding protein Ku